MDEGKTITSGEKEWYSPREAGQLIPGGLGAAGMRKWCREGQVPGARQLPSGRWLIPRSGIEKLLNDSLIPLQASHREREG